ncbi:MAG: Lrp/AsnC family transcriptional regulator [Balneolales bacterium]
MSYHLDETDITILNHLQKEGRTQRNKLATIVNLSVPSVSERMRKLQDRNYIDGYHAVLNSREFGFDITAFIFIEVESSAYYQKFVDKAVEEVEILECHSITGDGSHMLKIRTRNTASLESLLTRIQSWEGVKKSRSNIVLTTFKETRELPIRTDK